MTRPQTDSEANCTWISKTFIIFGIVGTSLLAQPSFAKPASGTSTTTTPTELSGSLANEFVSLRPQVGFINFADMTQKGYTELALGVTADMNILKYSSPSAGLDSSRYFIGPETGLIFSHLSYTDSTFLNVPLNVKVGYMAMNDLRLAVHGGLNMTYRSTANAMRLSDGPVGNGAALTFLPNLGVDVDYAFNGFSLSVRPDVTFSSGNNIVSGMLELVVPFSG